MSALLTGTISDRLNTRQKVKTPSLKLQNTCILAINYAQVFWHNISNPKQLRLYSMAKKPQPLIFEAILVFLIAW